MKKILFFAVAVLLSASTFAQSKATEDKTESKTLEFMSRGSSLIKKEFYDLESVKGVKCQVLIVTDLLENRDGIKRLDVCVLRQLIQDIRPQILISELLTMMK